MRIPKRRKRGYSRRLRWKRKYGGPGFQALKIVRNIRSNIERKFVDFSLTNQNVSSDVPVITPLDAIAQGDDADDRTGNKITVKSIRIRGLVAMGVDNSCLFRIMVVVDKQQVPDSAITFALVLQAAEVYANRNKEQTGRFRVVWDKTIAINTQEAGEANYRVINKLITFGSKGLTIRYNGPADTDIQKNGVYLMMISNILAAATEPSVILRIRTTFTDL